MSTVLETLTQRNQAFVTNSFRPALSLMPKLRAMIITCADPRVDPVHIFGLEPGEAAIIRNVGGRITPGTLQNMMLLQLIGQMFAANPGGEFNLIVLHHTDCGITHLQEKPDLLAGYFGIEEADLPSKAIHDPHTSINVDLAVLKANVPLPPTWKLTGAVYDVETGHVEMITPT